MAKEEARSFECGQISTRQYSATRGDHNSLLFNCPATILDQKEKKGQLGTFKSRRCGSKFCVWPTPDTIHNTYKRLLTMAYFNELWLL